MKKQSSPFIAKILSFAREKKLWQRGERILAAVSGGPDSLGLLLFLHDVAEQEGLSVGCCLVQHHLREEAEEEARYVERICEQLGIPFFRRDVYVEEKRRLGGGSVETVARTLRYEALREVQREAGYTVIALAHHADDQAETILFHLLRGSGVRGLSGMAPKHEELIRPFLTVTKKEIEDFLTAFPYAPCHDATNDELAIERYNCMEEASDCSQKERYDFVNYALAKWGEWPRTNILRNALAQLTLPSFDIKLPDMVLPERKFTIKVENLVNLHQLDLTITRVNVSGDTRLDPQSATDLKALQKLADGTPAFHITRNYYGHPVYEVVSDTIDAAGLKPGMYLVEATGDANMMRQNAVLLHVSDVFLMHQPLPPEKRRALRPS